MSRCLNHSCSKFVLLTARLRRVGLITHGVRDETLEWYSAELPSGHTVVVRKGWTPPRDADFLETTSFHKPTAFPDSSTYTQQGDHDTENTGRPRDRRDQD